MAVFTLEKGIYMFMCMYMHDWFHPDQALWFCTATGSVVSGCS